MPFRFTHIVNPFKGANTPEEQQSRDITFRAMEQAAAHAAPVANVRLATAQFPEDKTIIPETYIKTTDLTKALNQLQGLGHTKKLPFMQEIVSRFHEFPDSDFYIYTNMDIIPAPGFYSTVADLIQTHQCDALIINRRRIKEKWKNMPDEIFRQNGLPHPGYDCFVFSKQILYQLQFGNAVIGVPGIGFLFAHNLFLFARKCMVFSDLKITYHLGLEIVKNWADDQVVKFQISEAMKFLKKHRKDFDIRKFPGYHLPLLKRHYIWLMSPLFSYPLMFKLDIKRLFDGRVIINDTLHGSGLMDWKNSQ
ncbi:MAG: hypothetical protein Fur0041_07960 [Bacteroidia bacterium]